MTADDRRRGAAPRAVERAWASLAEGRLEDALAGFDAAIAVDARDASALHGAALVLHRTGRIDAAVDRIERALALDDRDAFAWSNAGLIFEAAGRLDAATDAYRHAIACDPTLAPAWGNLASLALARGDAVAAERAAGRALTLAASPGARFNHALALAALGRHDEALAAIEPVDAASRSTAMVALAAECAIAAGRFDVARAGLDAALARADAPRLRLERARLADRQDDATTMEADYRAILGSAAIEQVLYESALSELTFAKKRRLDFVGLDALTRTFRAGVVHHAKRQDASWLSPFGFLSDDSTRGEQREAAAAWSRRFATGPRTKPSPRRGRLRIGYLSAGLQEHATAILAAGLFERHDRAAFEVFAYSTGVDDGGAMRRRIVAAVDRFHDGAHASDAALVETIRADDLDVLIDLDGHAAHARTAVIAARPAPIVVAYLGYPGTMGATFVDYAIADPIVAPPAEASDFTETLALLPSCYQVNDDRRETGPAPSRASLGLPDDAVVLCAFHAPYKLGTAVLDAWAAIVRRTPAAVLWLQPRGPASMRERMVAAFAARGVAGERLRFAPELPHRDYLGLLRVADLFVDAWPYNAHTTGSDALWAGCPVLTVRGATFASRVGESLLAAVGRPGWVARDVPDYVERAVAWAGDRAALSAMRAELERDVRRAPLFDTAGTTRMIEAAYRAMIAQALAGRRETIAVRR